MSFNIYVYGTDAGVSSTEVFVYSVSSYSSIEQNKSYDGDPNTPLIISVPCNPGDTRTIRFRCTTTSEATFSQWAYRINNVAYTSTDQTLYLDNISSDVHIHADSAASGSGNWTAEYVGTGVYTVSAATSLNNISINARQMRVIRLEFTSAGTATFTGLSGQNIRAYLTDTSSFSPSDGLPTGTILAYDTSESSSFSMQYSVTVGTTYYLWIRYTSASASGTASATITLPSGGGGGGGGGGSGGVRIFNGSEWVQATPYIYTYNTDTGQYEWKEATPYIFDGSDWAQAT